MDRITQGNRTLTEDAVGCACKKAGNKEPTELSIAELVQVWLWAFAAAFLLLGLAPYCITMHLVEKLATLQQKGQSPILSWPQWWQLQGALVVAVIGSVLAGGLFKFAADRTKPLLPHLLLAIGACFGLFGLALAADGVRQIFHSESYEKGGWLIFYIAAWAGLWGYVLKVPWDNATNRVHDRAVRFAGWLSSFTRIDKFIAGVALRFGRPSLPCANDRPTLEGREMTSKNTR